jgi:hypothetical protein
LLLAATLTIAALADWVPARWPSADPATLDLIAGTPINCLLLERAHWNSAFAKAAAEKGIATLGVVRSGVDHKPALDLGITGLVFQGVPAPSGLKVPVIEVTLRSKMRFQSDEPILASDQGVWAGIRQDEQTGVGPTAAPWIDTNTGFLRFARAASKSTIWIANVPPSGKKEPVSRYLTAIGDAAMAGARWVLALDESFAERLLARESSAVADWKKIAMHLRYWEEHNEWRAFSIRSTLALVEDAGSGALLSGGVLDMIAVKHTPVRPVPGSQLASDRLERAQLCVNVDPESLTAQQKETLRAFARAGGTLFTGPPGWRFPSLKPEQISLAKEDLDKLDQIWKELNSLTGRRNLGARLFNVSSMLSNLVESPDGKQVALHLVNYSDYQVENITVHLLGTFKRARLFQPDRNPIDLAVYSIEDGTGVDLEKLGAFGTIVLN